MRIAAAHGARVRCLFLDTPLDQAQVNVVQRMLRRLQRVPEPDELRTLARHEPAALAPRVLQRASAISSRRRPTKVRRHRGHPLRARAGAGGRGGAVIVAADALPAGAAAEIDLARHLERGAPGRLACCTRGARISTTRTGAAARDRGRRGARERPRRRARAVRARAGLPRAGAGRPCGAALTFAHRHGVDLASSTLVGASATDRALARALGATFVDACS